MAFTFAAPNAVHYDAANVRQVIRNNILLATPIIRYDLGSVATL